jgi:hypothetical protein
MKIFVSLLLLILLRKCICVQPYFPPQLLFFASGTLYAIDEINQKAYKSASSSIKSSETAYAMKHFPNAIPDSPESKYYVQLSDEFPQPGCRYATYWEHGGGTFNSFPEHWSNGTSFEIKNFIHFKYEMIRSTNSSVFEDYWYSNETCHPQSPKPVPCEEIYFRKGTDIPVRTTQVISTPWEVRQFTTEYLMITVGKPDDKYFEPIEKDWAFSCRDINLGVLYNTQTAKIDLNQSVKIQVWLSTPPHRINGNDTLQIQWKSNQCNDCFTLKPKQLHFNIQNFNEKQTLTITRVKNGPETDLIPIFNGGGFDQLSTKNYTIHIQ